MRSVEVLFDTTRGDCCTTLNSKVLATRTNTATGFHWVPEGIKVRIRKCYACGTEWATFEESIDRLFEAFKADFLQRAVRYVEAQRARQEQVAHAENEDNWKKTTDL